jgi:hypothetical protein
MALEELAAIGVVENDRNDEEDDPIGVVLWQLSGDDGAVITDVFKAHRASGGGWDETWVYTSPSPPIREEESSNSRGEPTLRPTPVQSTFTHCQACGQDNLHNAAQRQRGTCGPCHMNHGTNPTAEQTA